MDNLTLMVVGLVVVILAVNLVSIVVIGAVFVFAWANEQGFIGVAVYFACWILLFPFMLLACLITGAVITWQAKMRS